MKGRPAFSDSEAASSTLMNFFPFAGLDIIDPDGVTIGDNRSQRQGQKMQEEQVKG
jgi:hypothetical protein